MDVHMDDADPPYAVLETLPLAQERYPGWDEAATFVFASVLRTLVLPREGLYGDRDETHCRVATAFFYCLAEVTVKAAGQRAEVLALRASGVGEKIIDDDDGGIRGSMPPTVLACLIDFLDEYVLWVIEKDQAQLWAAGNATSKSNYYRLRWPRADLRNFLIDFHPLRLTNSHWNVASLRVFGRALTVTKTHFRTHGNWSGVSGRPFGFTISSTEVSIMRALSSPFPSQWTRTLRLRIDDQLCFSDSNATLISHLLSSRLCNLRYISFAIPQTSVTERISTLFDAIASLQFLETLHISTKESCLEWEHLVLQLAKFRPPKLRAFHFAVYDTEFDQASNFVTFLEAIPTVEIAQLDYQEEFQARYVFTWQRDRRDVTSRLLLYSCTVADAGGYNSCVIYEDHDGIEYLSPDQLLRQSPLVEFDSKLFIESTQGFIPEERIPAMKDLVIFGELPLHNESLWQTSTFKGRLAHLSHPNVRSLTLVYSTLSAKNSSNMKERWDNLYGRALPEILDLSANGGCPVLGELEIRLTFEAGLFSNMSAVEREEMLDMAADIRAQALPDGTHLHFSLKREVRCTWAEG